MLFLHIARSDLAGTLLAVCLFTLIAYVPGYVVGWLANALDFRSQTAAWKFVIAVPVSISIGPILAYWIDIVAGRTGVWAAFAICWLGFAALVAKALASQPGGFRLPSLHLPSGTSVAIVCILIAWIALAIGAVLDLQFDDRLYGSITASDQAFRTAFTDAITRTGIAHPNNPLYYANGPAPLRYHYFWFILCSLVDQLGGAAVSARQAFVASIAWSGIALGCVIAAFLRFFAPEGKADIGPRTLTGILLLTVTGLDIIPSLILLREHVFYPDMEWWNEAVTSWAGTLLWVPNHAGGLVAGLIAFLILWDEAESKAPQLKPHLKWVAAAVAGIALAGMVGISIYVALVFAVFLSLWTVITFLAGWRNHTAVLVLAGLIAVVLAFPYLKSLTGPASGGSFIQFTVRNFRGSAVFHLTSEYAEPWKTYLARLVLLPLNYLIELGFFLMVGIIQIARLWSRRRLTPDSVAAVTMVLTSVAICTFLKSGVISNNDLGWRGFLPAQFMLLIWAVDLLRTPAAALEEEKNWFYAHLSPVLPLFLVIGIVSTAYSVGGLRFAEWGYDVGPDYTVGRRNYAARQVYEQLQGMLPIAAIVQQNPDQDVPQYWGLYSNRQTAASDRECGSVFGGSLQDCRQVYPAVSAIFSARGASAEEAEEVCRKLKIDALVVTDGDPVWKVSNSWVWTMQPSVAKGSARGFLIMPAEQRSAQSGLPHE